MYVTAKELVAEWQQVREDFKLEGKKLNAREQAGLLIEELGSVEAALRLVIVHQDAPALIELEKPQFGRDLREILSYAWYSTQGDFAPTVASLQDDWAEVGSRVDLEVCTNVRMHVGAILTDHGDRIGAFVQELGCGLYSNFHYTRGFATHPLAREILFLLDMVLWRQKVEVKR